MASSYQHLDEDDVAAVDDMAAVNDDGLILCSEGASLKYRTRNYPQRTASDVVDLLVDVNTTQANQHLSADVNATQTTEHLSKLYSAVGETLSSPSAVAGSIKLASSFTTRAKTVNHFYRNRWFIAASVLCMALFTTGIGFISIGVTNTNSLIFYGLGLIILPWIILLITGCIKFNCTHCCNSKLQLTTKLRSVEQFLSLCEISNDEFRQLSLENDYGFCDCRVVGSAADGFGFFPSQGSNMYPCEKKTVVTQDVDLNLFMNTLELRREHMVAIPGVTGFTWIKLSIEESSQVTDPVIKASLIPALDGSGYFVAAANISREASKYFTTGSSSSNTTVIEHFPALTVTTSARGPNGVQEYELDYAFALRYRYWPEQASEWLSRERYGVDKNTIRHIASRGCYLVHKPCGHSEPLHPHDFDWRYTFASAEADLFHYHRDKRALKLVFVILKFALKHASEGEGAVETLPFLHWLAVVCGAMSNSTSQDLSVLRTYHLKTVFLWMAEEETDLDYYTIQGNKTLGEVFLAMLDRYIRCVENEDLPNYFIRERNMFATERYARFDFRGSSRLLKKMRAVPTTVISLRFELPFISRKPIGICVGIFSVLSVLLMVENIVTEITNNNNMDYNTTYSNGGVNGSSTTYWNGSYPNAADARFTSLYLDYLEQLYNYTVQHAL